MKWIASTIENKMALLPYHEINTKNYVFLMISSHFRPFLLTFLIILLIIFTIFLGHQNPGPGNKQLLIYGMNIEIAQMMKYGDDKNRDREQ